MNNILKRAYAQYAGDSLKKNSTLLILGQAVSTAAGFLFWIICAHAFRPSQIGFAASLLSYAGLAATFTGLGLSNTLIRFLPTSTRKGGLLTGSIAIVLLASVIGGLTELAGLRTFAPRLSFVSSSAFLSLMLVLLVVGSNVSSLLDSTLLAFRKANLVLGKSVLVNSLRLIMPLFVVALGLSGIISIYATVFWAGILYGLFIVFRVLLPRESFMPALQELTKHRSYTLSNYLGGMLGALPGTLTPIIILAKLGPTSAAYYYMPMQVAAFLGILSSSVSQALISETSQSNNPESDRIHFRSALLHLYRLLIPAVACLLAAGWFILRAYGPAYAANGFGPLAVLILTSLLVGLNWLGDTWLNIKKRHQAYFYMNAFNAAAVVAGVYLMAGKGLLYAALGALLGQAISAAVYIVIFARSQLLSLALFTNTR
jgi:O-antigen/teichoic acid export membrane protein